jgi:proline iminopeptidase
MPTLYPDIKINLQHSIAVDETHELHVEECGNSEGIPVLFLHGGPGAGIEPYHRRFFNPEKYRMILFDQRGSGKSTPHASLENNTTQHLVSDIEVIRQQLNIDQWIVFGGSCSWGSTLSLVYGQTHPDHVKALVLRGIFLCREKEIQWFYQSGASKIYPDYWQDFIAPVPVSERDNIVNAYYKILTGKNDIARMTAAKAWSLWEGRTASIAARKEVIHHFSQAHTALSVALIECHYFVNNSFLEPNQILNNLDNIRHIPAYIIQGRYDMICPMESAWELHQAWPEANFTLVRDAGHAASEPGIISALVSIMDELARQEV